MKTSIAYQVSNIMLRNKIYGHAQEFMNILDQGPEKMKMELFNMWNEARQKLSEDENVELIDINKNFSEKDFDITSNVTKNNIRIFYFIFPDSDEAFAQCKCVALALTDKMPRYFTMEYFSKENGQESFVFGEWVLNLNDNNFTHHNHGKLVDPTIANFAYRVQEELERI